MRSQSGGRQRTVGRRWFELEPPIAERMGLETSPRLSTVANYVFTAAARRAWEALNQHLEGQHGGVFWIGGPAGCGKTHFLNYVIALQKRAGALDTHNARRLVCGLELAGRIDGAEVELILLRVLAEQIGGDPRTADIFRQMRGAAALKVSLENARRMGIGAATVAIDFATSSYDGTAEFFAMLSEVAASFPQLKFTVIAAGRAAAPASAKPLQVAPRDNDELTTIAVRRARQLIDDADSAAIEAYQGIDTNGLPPSAIYPFHPRTLQVLTRIAATPDVDGDAGEPVTIVSLSRLARSALDSPSILGGRYDSSTPLLYPPDLTANPAASDRIKDRLSQSERAAWKIARDAADALDAHEREFAREIVDTIVVEHAATVKLEELKTLVPTIAFASASNVQAVSFLPDLLRRLEISTGGAIRLDADTVRFDPEAAGAPELAAFNSALMLARRFGPRLTIARDRDGLAERLHRLDAAMANAVEAAAHTREMLESTLREANLQPPAASIAAIARYIELAESGAPALLDAAADRSRVGSLVQTIDAYDALASVAAAFPRMRAMREFLAGTGLRALHEDGAPLDGGARESAVTALETECELLQVELGPRVLTGPPRNLDALEARFQKFKWTYVQCYLSAHARWREKMARLNLVMGDARRYFDALARLNRITALGAPEGAQLGALIAELGTRVVRCELGDAIAPETTPLCPSCAFKLGASSPQAALEDAMEAIRRALEVKLAALSQSVIARLISEHDREHRLEGFLKITQAAQTDALVRVLDEKLARYLAQVLHEAAARKDLERPRSATIKAIKR